AGQPFAMLDRQPADHQRNARLERVRIKSIPNSHHGIISGAVKGSTTIVTDWAVLCIEGLRWVNFAKHDVSSPRVAFDRVLHLLLRKVKLRQFDISRLRNFE